MLAGKDGTETYEVGGGNRIPLGDNTHRAGRSTARTCTLTIDRDLQWYTQRVLRQTVAGRAAATPASAVVMDTRTGELLRWPTTRRSTPTQPGAVAEGGPRLAGAERRLRAGLGREGAHRSRAASTPARSPRSTWIMVPPELPVAATASSTTGSTTARSDLTLAGVIAQVLQHRHGAGRPTVHARASCYDYLDAFGLGQRTDIGVHGETPGMLPTASIWTAARPGPRSPSARALSVNAVQMAAAVNTIANGGVLVAPEPDQGPARPPTTARSVGTDTTTTHRVVSARAAHRPRR